jgi:hypothetical protein
VCLFPKHSPGGGRQRKDRLRGTLHLRSLAMRRRLGSLTGFAAASLCSISFSFSFSFSPSLSFSFLFLFLFLFISLFCGPG